MTDREDQQAKREQKRFWSLGRAALLEVESWPAWKQAAAGAASRDPLARKREELAKASS